MKESFFKKYFRVWFLALLVLAACPAVTAVSAQETQAAVKTGFTTEGNKTYYIDADGSKHKGWLKLNGKKYYFDKTTGVQLKGWMINSKGQKVRYFTKGAGYMVTGFLKNSSGGVRYFDKSTGMMVRGWMTDSAGYKYYFTKGSGIMMTGWAQDSKGQKRYFSKTTGRMLTGLVKTSTGYYRYFHKTTGVMYTGLKRAGNYYYYFSKTTGYRYQKGFGTVSGKKYYFSPSNGRAHTGWLELDGKKYYFNSVGVMYVSTTATISGKQYTFDANGVATEVNYTISGDKVQIYDATNKRYYWMKKEFLTHPDVANGQIKDVDLLAAVCDSEAGDQGLIGMEAVALCVLNRTIKADREFPSEVRYVVYHTGQYSVVENGQLLKRLNGQWESSAARTQAYEAANAALEIFKDYVTSGTKRVLNVKEFKNRDFNFMYFMMESAYYQQPLAFDKVDNVLYKDHMFFVDWVSP